MIPLLEPHITENAYKYIKDCLDTGWISYAGGYVSRLEKAVEDIVGENKKAVALNSGTSAIYLALKTLGVGPGDHVVVPTMTFVATANAVVQTGASPVFVDCDSSLCMDICALESALSSVTVKAIIPVHILGHMCNMDKIMKVATRHAVSVVEDAAQALGSYLDGRHAGTFGDIGIFSFSFNKMVTAGGGGMIIADKYIAERVKYLALQAKDNQVMYIHNEPGYNMGIGNLNAALALSQIENIKEFREKKISIWNNYKESLEVSDKMTMVDGLGDCNRWLSAVRLNKYISASTDISHLIKVMENNGIQIRPMFKPNNRQAAFKGSLYFGKIEADNAYKSIICLPSSIGMTDDQQLSVIEALLKL